MNETINNILTRRSVREYQKEQITDGQLNLILECAKSAPSGHNKQPWRFVVVQNKELIEEMSRICFDENVKKGYEWYLGEDYYSPFYDAPTVIFVLRYKKPNDLAVIDCALATENIAIAANSLGLGSCILADALTLFDKKFGTTYYEKLHITDDFVPQIAISLGYPNENPCDKRMRDNVVDIIR